jgi:16S rRNA (guanine966-N2)-methyltransferase
VLRFPAIPGLRPTPDRVRETVFNWLAPYIEDANCLDLFAGSGAFGFEAASRGAAQVTMVERDPEALRALQANASMLDAKTVRIVPANVLDFLSLAPAQDAVADIVFLDPPYAGGLLETAFARLVEQGWVRAGGWVYLETPALTDPVLPDGWERVRSKRAGKVGYHLARQVIKNEAEK